MIFCCNTRLTAILNLGTKPNVRDHFQFIDSINLMVNILLVIEHLKAGLYKSFWNYFDFTYSYSQPGSVTSFEDFVSDRQSDNHGWSERYSGQRFWSSPDTEFWSLTGQRMIDLGECEIKILSEIVHRWINILFISTLADLQSGPVMT